MPPHADAVAECVLSAFRCLPAKCKPRLLAEGRREWTPLAGIVVDSTKSLHSTSWNSEGRAKHETENDKKHSGLTCVSLATGMKCLPRSKVPHVKGNVLHDWHAEILALRAFNRWILDQCSAARSNGSLWVRERSEVDQNLKPPFELTELIEGIYMYCSEAPCGDASMELTMADQEDSAPWETAKDESSETEMLGRGHFDRLGIVRRKPARADAPLSLSKSCSDKLAMKQVTGLLSAVGSLLINMDERLFLKALVLPEERVVPTAVERAWGKTGRMRACAGLRPFEVWTTTQRFEFEKTTDATPSNLSVMSTAQKQEILINGVLQGRKQTDPRGRSCTSRRAMLEDLHGMGLANSYSSYAELKHSPQLHSRELVKQQTRLSLQPWERNTGDENWGFVP